MAQAPVRERILGVAGDLFHRRGYGAVSVEAVIRASGLPKADFYRTFASKADLGRAWLEGLTRRMELFHGEFLSRPGAPQKRLRRYFQSMRSWVETNEYRSCQFANTAACLDEDADGELALLVDRYKRGQLRFFIELAGTLVEESEARRVGTAVYLLYSGAMTECQNLRATWPMEEALACAERLCGVDSEVA